VCKQIQLKTATDKQEIDSHYLEGGNAFVNNMELKPDLFNEIQSLVFQDLEKGIDYKTICQKYIWH